MLSCFPWIETGNATGRPSDVLVDSLDLCGTIISRLNFSPSSLLTKEFFLVIIEALTVCRNGHENMVFECSSSVTSRASRSTFGSTPSDLRCDTNGRHSQLEVLQLSPFLSRKRKDRVRLMPQEQPPLSRTLRSENPRTHESRFGLSEFNNVGKVFCVESYRPNASRFGLPVSASVPAKLDHLFQGRSYLIYLCHVRAYALPTQNGNYQLLIWIN